MNEGHHPTPEELGVSPAEQPPTGGEAQVEVEKIQDLADFIAELYAAADQDLPDAQGASVPAPEPEPESEAEPVPAPETEAESTPTPTATPEPTIPEEPVEPSPEENPAEDAEKPEESEEPPDAADTPAEEDPEDPFKDLETPHFTGEGHVVQIDLDKNVAILTREETIDHQDNMWIGADGIRHDEPGIEQKQVKDTVPLHKLQEIIMRRNDDTKTGSSKIVVRPIWQENWQFQKPLEFTVNTKSLDAALLAADSIGKAEWDDQTALVEHELLEELVKPSRFLTVDARDLPPGLDLQIKRAEAGEPVVRIGKATFSLEEARYALEHSQLNPVDGSRSLVFRSNAHGEPQVKVDALTRIVLSHVQYTELSVVVNPQEYNEPKDVTIPEVSESNLTEIPVDQLKFGNMIKPILTGPRPVIVLRHNEKDLRWVGLDEIQVALKAPQKVRNGVVQLLYRHDAQGQEQGTLDQPVKKVRKIQLTEAQLEKLRNYVNEIQAQRSVVEAEDTGAVESSARETLGMLRATLEELVDDAKSLLSRVRGSRQAANPAEGGSPQPQPEAQPAPQPAAEQTPSDEIPEVIRQTRQAVDASPGATPDQFTLQEDPEVSDKRKLDIEVAEKVLKQTLFKKREQRERVRTSFLDHLTRQGLSYTETGGEHAGEHVTVLTADQLRAVLTDPRFLNDVGWHLVQREIKNNLRRRNYADATKALAEVIADRFSDDSRDKKEFITELKFALEEFFTLELPYVEYPGLLTLPAQEKANTIATAAQNHAQELGISAEQAAEASQIIRMVAADVEAGESQLAKVSHVLREELGMSDARIALLLKLASEAKLGRNPEAQPAPTEQTESQEAQERMTEFTDALADKLMLTKDGVITRTMTDDEYRAAVDQLTMALKERLRQGGQLRDRASVDRRVAEVQSELKNLPANASIPWLNKDEYAQAKAIFGSRKTTVRYGLMTVKVKLG